MAKLKIYERKCAKLKTPSTFVPQVLGGPFLENSMLGGENLPSSITTHYSENISSSNVNHPFVMSSSSVCPMEYQFNLSSILSKSNRIEILLSMFVQNLLHQFSTSQHASINDMTHIDQLNQQLLAGSNINEFVEKFNRKVRN